MSTDATTWTERSRPARLERRLAFADYDALRDFLDALATLSEASGLYPDISFGRTSVSLCIQAEEGAAGLSGEQRDLARCIDALIGESLATAA